MRPFDLYRFYDADDRLLYVGISLTTVQRMQQHRDTQPWWADVARSTVQHLTTTDRAEAEKAERQAIINERPVHNVIWNGRKPAGWLAGDGKADPGSLPVEFEANGFPAGLLADIQIAIDALGRVLDDRSRTHDDAPTRDDFIRVIDGITRSVVYGDCCPKCFEIRYPFAIKFDSPTWLRGAYHCHTCDNTWSCGWTRDLAVLGALG